MKKRCCVEEKRKRNGGEEDRPNSKFFVCLFAAARFRVRVRVQLWLWLWLDDDLRRRRRSLQLLRLRGGGMARRRYTDDAPPRALLRVLLRIAVRQQRARRVDRRVAHAADPDVRLVVAEEPLPVFHALSCKKTKKKSNVFGLSNASFTLP
jgi:hypothetical protein